MNDKHLLNRRERKKEETRDNIIQCALVLFRQKGFEQTSMEEIAATADIAKGTLYNYFPDKESVLTAFIQGRIAEYGGSIESCLIGIRDIKTRLYMLLDFVNSIVTNDTELATVYVKFRLQHLFENNPADGSRRSGVEGILHKILLDAQLNNEIRDDIPAIVLTRSFQFLIRSYLQAAVESEQPLDLNMFKGQLIDYFLNGARR